jgi:hypothetical protein
VNLVPSGRSLVFVVARRSGSNVRVLACELSELGATVAEWVLGLPPGACRQPFGEVDHRGSEDNPEGWSVIGDVREGHPSEGRQARWYWRSDADGVATWGPTRRPVPQRTRPGATPVETLGRHGHHH